ncbi:MAG: 5-(carboxyamino)imidazole ribonucleotide synthase [Acidiphilium sp.]|nr:5-(carboxyamino)imidazole ribonucleotide synthase [Acidiphilium sp.]MDD4935501.1 5-(carboxyamino)imidazole ribonucleotide synthase [Acidiphilium sp.]
MTFPLPPNATIGIVGGGQLGRMSAMAAARLGYRCHIFTPEPDAPASQVASATTLADYDDNAALIRFADAVDVITFEFENISAEGLDLLAERKPVRPGPDILRISQDRIAEKTFLNAAGVRTTPWAAVETLAQLRGAIESIGLPAVLKTTRFGYDGKGQALIQSPGEAEIAFALLNPKPLILEGFVDFACECSVIAARGTDGSITAFDTVENRHRDHILDLTLAPAPFDPDLRREAQDMAMRVAEHLELVGLMAVEFFIDAKGRILANEIAPRPHNSGHWTIDACPASQFELHIRAVAGLTLPPAIRHSDAVMKNLVGPADIAQWSQVIATPGLIPHHYGKTAARDGRKLGHVTTLFPHSALPGAFGIAAALGPLATQDSIVIFP